MDEYDVRRLALILSVQTEIEGMKAKNKDCELAGMEMAYKQHDFDAKAQRLSDLAHSHNIQLF